MKAYSEDLRNRVVKAYLAKEGTIKEIAARFRVSQCFVIMMLKLHRVTGGVKAKEHGGGNPGKIVGKDRDVLDNIIKEKSDLTRAEMALEMKTRTGIEVSVTTIGRMLKKLGYSQKKKIFRASERYKPGMEEKRENYLKVISGTDVNRLYFLDESGCNLAMARKNGWSSCGSRVYGSKPFNHGKNVTMLGVLGISEILASMVFDGPVNGSAILAFVKQELAPKLKSGDVVIMDNLSSHKVNGIVESIESSGAKLIYLPPYSPELSPIEEFWSKIKNVLRKKCARILNHLYDAIAEAFDHVTSTDIRGWFTHAGYHIEGERSPL